MDYYVSSGMTSSGIKLSKNDYMAVSAGGVASGTTLNSKGLLVVDGGTATGVSAHHKGEAWVLSGGMISDVTFYDGGQIFVSEGGTASNVTFNSSGSLHVSSGGKLTGQLQLSNAAHVFLWDDCTLDFDVSRVAPGAAARISDLSLIDIDANTNFTITVSATPVRGSYVLAGGASAAGGIFQIGTTAESYGTLTINGEDLTHGDCTFGLTVSHGDLVLSVISDYVSLAHVVSTGADVTTATDRNVIVTAIFNDAVVTKQYSLDNRTWKTYTKGIVMTANGVVYFRGIDAAGNVSEVASYAVTNIIVAAPDMPTGLTVSVSKYDVTASWQKAAAPKGVKVSYEVSVDGGDPIKATSNKYTIKNAEVGEHFFTVRTVLSNGETSEWCDDVFAVVADVTAPKAGKVTIEQIDDDAVLVTWTAATDNVGIDRYVVTCGGETQEVDGDTFEAEFYGVTGKVEATVTAYDEAGNAAKPVKKSVTLKDVTPPEQVTGLNFLADANGAGGTLTWDKPYDNSGTVAQYQVLVDGKTKYTAKTNSLKVKKLAAGEHTFTVVAVDKAKNASEESEVGFFEIADVTAPKAGKIMVEQTADDTVRVAWTAATDDVGVDRYVVTCGGEEQEVDGDTFEAEFYGLAGKIEATVTAYDAAGNAAKPVKKSITIKDVTPPDQVTGLDFLAADDGVGGTLMWDEPYDNSGSVAQYQIVVDGKTKYTSKTNSVKIKKLAAGEHTFTVVAYDAAKNASEVSDVGFFFIEDVTAPTLSGLAVSVKDTDATVKFKGTDDVAVEGYFITLDGEENFFDAADCPAAGIVFDHLAFGDHRVSVQAQDSSGNLSAVLTKDFTVKSPSGAVALDTDDAIAVDWNELYYLFEDEVWSGETQLYRVDAETDGMFIFRRSEDNNVKGSMTVYRELDDGLCKKLSTTQLPAAERKPSVATHVEEGGVYYVAVTASGSENLDIEAYGFAVDPWNNSFQDATEIGEYDPCNGYLCASDPVDYYHFWIDYEDKYEVGVGDITGGNARQTLYDGSFNKIASSGVDHDYTVRTLAAGEYYLKCEYTGQALGYTAGLWLAS